MKICERLKFEYFIQKYFHAITEIILKIELLNYLRHL